MVDLLRRHAPALLLALLLGPVNAAAVDDATTLASRDQLADLDIEQLMDIEISSVSKRMQKLSDSPAAIAVVTGEDIRRMGATSIPDALRMVPGLHVAHIDANKWVVAARGFSDQYANKLLVLIDGRSVYTPLFSGVYWDVQDVMLEDVERIEVIRGPGATLWGANAVNGVINIITKTAKDTQGALASGGWGNEETGFGGGRYGFALNDRVHGRVYGKYFHRDAFVSESDHTGADEWEQGRAGFRLDADAGDDDVTLQGDLYRGASGATYRFWQTETANGLVSFEGDDQVRGGNLISRFTHHFSDTSSAQLQLYYDRTERDIELYREIRDTFDVDFQHDFAICDWQRVIWGTNYRWTKDRVTGVPTVRLTETSRIGDFVSAFLQDEISILETVRLYLGTKAEYNSYTGFEIQPGARLAWTPNEQHTLWASVARAVRTPARVDDDIVIDIPPPVNLTSVVGFPATGISQVRGTRHSTSEDLLAIEGGWRWQPVPRLSFDAAAFYNFYEDLRSVEAGAPPTSEIFAAFLAFLGTGQRQALVIPGPFDNLIDGETYGSEVSANWQPLDWWRLGVGWSWLKVQLANDERSVDVTSEASLETAAPEHMIHLKSQMDLPFGVQLDSYVSYVDNLASKDVDAYVRVDARLGWSPMKSLQLDLVGQNLFSTQHEEFASPILGHATEVERSVFGKVTWRY